MPEKQTKKPPLRRVGARPGVKAGPGRPKGSLDKGNALIRQMIVEALDQVGGVEYLTARALDQPAAFMSLIGKVMPVQVQADANVTGSITVEFVKP